MQTVATVTSVTIIVCKIAKTCTDINLMIQFTMMLLSMVITIIIEGITIITAETQVM